MSAPGHYRGVQAAAPAAEAFRLCHYVALGFLPPSTCPVKDPAMLQEARALHRRHSGIR